MYFIAFLGHFEVKILKKYVKFCENSQSTNILPQIWLKVQILFPPPPWHFWRIYTPEPENVLTHDFLDPNFLT